MMTIPEILKILKHLYERGADCECGGVQLTLPEIAAIKAVIESLERK